MFSITPLQKLWLTSRGGRTINDVVIHKNKPCVIMRYENEDNFIPLPSDKYIMQVYRVKSERSDVMNNNYYRLVLQCRVKEIS